MFGHKGCGWKLAGALALSAALGVYCNERGNDINPPLWRCLAEPARWAGAELWIPAGTVTRVDPGGFEIDSGGTKVAVRGVSDVKELDLVSLTGTFEGGKEPHLRLHKVRRLPERWKLRWLSETISVAILILIAVNFLRRFSFHPEALRIGRGREEDR